MGVVVGVATVAAVVAAGAFGGSGGLTITRFAGTGLPGFTSDGGPATLAELNQPFGVAVDGQGNVYIADSENNGVRKVNPRGTITTFAGTGPTSYHGGFSGDGGPATSAQLAYPMGVAIDARGNVFIADTNNNRVRKIDPRGIITTFAGTGRSGFSGDGGPATLAELNLPYGVAVDAWGNVYIADEQNDQVRKIDPCGTITTLAGTGRSGFSGDGGPATSAELSSPEGVAVDGQGNIYIVDTVNRRVRKVSVGGRITTFAPTGKPAGARLFQPEGVAVDGEENVYIGDPGAQKVLKVSGGRMTTFAGEDVSYSRGCADDPGPALGAAFRDPSGVVVDTKGNVYIADRSCNVVRRVMLRSASKTIALHPSIPAGSIARGTTVTFTATVLPLTPSGSPAIVRFEVYHLVGCVWRLASARNVAADATRQATLPWAFSTAGSWYVRAKALANGTYLASAWSPLVDYTVG